MTRRAALFRRFCRDDRGTAIMEFALTAPLFLLVLMGLFDYSWQMYAKQVLQGAVSDAARAATLEGSAADQTALDTAVREKVQNVYRDANVTFVRKAYESFDDIGDPENFTDEDGDNSYDTGECFEDVNANASWDSDRGSAGNGGAEDVVLYTVSMNFDRILPVWRMMGQPQYTTLTATTVLRNQPYNTSTEASEVICE